VNGGWTGLETIVVEMAAGLKDACEMTFTHRTGSVFASRRCSLNKKKKPNLQAVSQNRIISTPFQVLRTFYPKLALPLREKKTLKIKT
jgi:hypothetical protein